MGCSSWGVAGYGATEADYKRWEHDSPLAEALCELCATLEINQRQIMITPKAYAWWKAHKERDLKRLEDDQKRAKTEADKQTALAKLTPYERTLLGIK